MAYTEIGSLISIPKVPNEVKERMNNWDPIFGFGTEYLKLFPSFFFPPEAKADNKLVCMLIQQYSSNSIYSINLLTDVYDNDFYFAHRGSPHLATTSGRNHLKLW